MKIRQTPWRTLTGLTGAAATWHVRSQQQSRRNALVASTALTLRRVELLEVEEFLVEHLAVRARRGEQRAPLVGHSA